MTAAGSARWSRGLLAASALLVLAIVGAARWRGLDALRVTGARRSLSPQALGSGRLARGLQDLGLIEPVPFTVDEPGRAGRRPPVVFRFASLDPWSLPSSRAVPPEQIRRGLRIVSVVLPERHLQELLSAPNARGKETERPAYVTLFDDGELVFASGTGLRLHGGRSRVYSEHKSYRLYFDRRYGVEGLPASALGWQGESLTRLVLHNDVRTDAAGVERRFANPLAYELSRRLGAWAPQTAPALVFLNGEEQGLYFLTERIDDEYLRRHFGHDDFVLLRTKRDAGRGRYRQGMFGLYALARLWTHRWPRLTVADAEEWIDLDSLASWLVAVSFCATTDAYQGALLRDQSDPRSRWFWIHWDMDHSFSPAKQPLAEPWEEDVLPELLARRRDDLRAVLLRRLLAEDPTFYRRLAARFSEALNHQLRLDDLRELVRAYEEIARDYGVEDRAALADLRAFLERRPEALRRQLRAALGFGESHRVTVTAPRGDGLTIDGHPWTTPYRGSYFAGGRLRVEASGRAQDGSVRWRLDSEPIETPGSVLELEVEGPLRVELEGAAPAAAAANEAAGGDVSAAG